MKNLQIVSWNCNGGFRKKFKVLLEAYPNADLFIIQECEDPDFYASAEYKALFARGFHSGSDNLPTKGIGVLPMGNHRVRRLSAWKRGDAISSFSYAPFVLDEKEAILPIWTHGKYVEEMIDYLELNKSRINENLIIIGDSNSCKGFNNHHPSHKNHSVLVEWLQSYGLADVYCHITGEEQGEETTPSFYLYRKMEKACQIDRAFASPNRIVDFRIAADHQFWLQYSDHIPICIDLHV